MTEEVKSGGWENWCGWCRKGDRVDTFGWAAVFIWAGLVLLADITGFASGLVWWDGWGVFFTGAGIIVLVGTAFRTITPRYRRSVLGGLIFGTILLGIGLGDIVSWFWPAALLAVGITILIKALGRPGFRR